MVDLDLEESSSMRTSYEEMPVKPYLLSNMHSTYREDDIEIGTINDESENSFEESKDGDATPTLPKRKSTSTFKDGEGNIPPTRKSTRKSGEGNLPPTRKSTRKSTL